MSIKALQPMAHATLSAAAKHQGVMHVERRQARCLEERKVQSGRAMV